MDFDRNRIEESDVARLLEAFASPQVLYRVFAKAPLSHAPLRSVESEARDQPLVEPELMAVSASVKPAIVEPPATPSPATIVRPAIDFPPQALPPAAIRAAPPVRDVLQPEWMSSPPPPRAAPRDVMMVTPAAGGLDDNISVMSVAAAPGFGPAPRHADAVAQMPPGPPPPVSVQTMRPRAAEFPSVPPSIMDIPGRTQDSAVLSQRAAMAASVPVLGMYHRIAEAPAPEPAHQPPAVAAAQPDGSSATFRFPSAESPMPESRLGETCHPETCHPEVCPPEAPPVQSIAPEPPYRPRPVAGGADLRDVFRKLR